MIRLKYNFINRKVAPLLQDELCNIIYLYYGKDLTELHE